MSKILSRIAWNGDRVSCSSFTSSKRYDFKDDEQRKRVHALPLTKYENGEDIDNGEKYEWYEVGSGKYDRDMYCPKTNIRRSQTTQEFYGNSTVD